MALLQIAEPGKSAAPHQRRVAVGIDLGTTNSLVAAMRSGVSEVLADEQGRFLLPSVVHYGEAGSIELGDAAAKKANQDPLNTIASAKRLIGKGIDEVEPNNGYDVVAGPSNLAAYRTRSGEKTPVEIAAEILKALIDRAQKCIGDEVNGAVITVPAYFDDTQRQATKDAATLAGINVLRLLNEPTAAAVAYGLDHQASGIHAIYDLGGGTFDISILNLSKGVFEVLATGGNTALGGDDFDQLIAQWIAEQAGCGELGVHQQRYLNAIARAAKESLAEQDAAKIDLCEFGLQWHGELSLAQMNALIEPIIRRTLRACKKTLRDSGVDVTDIEQVVMVGGSTRVLSVREQVGELFQLQPLVSIDPDRVVAMGAAIQADILIGNRPDSEMLLLDVLPLSLGIETVGGLAEKIIPRNTTLPVSRAQEFTTYQDGQVLMSMHVLQGEREMVQDCRSLAKFTLRDIPAAVAGAVKIRVTFQVDADGLLTVSAQELTTQKLTQVEVKPSFGLEEVEIRRMLQESFASAAEDAVARALREAQVDGQRLLDALDAAIAEDGDLLTEDEAQVLSVEMDALRELVASEQKPEIENAIAHLNKSSEAFAAARMNASIEVALTGKSIDSLE